MRRKTILSTLLFCFLVSCGPTTRIGKSYDQYMHILNREDFTLLADYKPFLLEKISGKQSLSLEEIFALNELGFRSSTIINIIDITKTKIHMTSSVIVRMQDEGVSFQVITYLMGLE